MNTIYKCDNHILPVIHVRSKRLARLCRDNRAVQIKPSYLQFTWQLSAYL